mmetsp:Transcript_15828/g.23332  ORF Transcript_15828/g.23332 Transcript_15828/m.23332 type:complete len:125 (-) Transcript_15828:172-546(-)
MAPGEVGHAKLKEAYDAFEALPDKALASGVILHRRDEMVADMTFKWVPCFWKISWATLSPFNPWVEFLKRRMIIQYEQIPSTRLPNQSTIRCNSGLLLSTPLLSWKQFSIKPRVMLRPHLIQQT